MLYLDNMLTEGQKNYLAKLPPERANRTIKINSYDPRTKEIAEAIINRVKEIIPEADIRFMGSSSLGISGQNDVDIYIICPAELREAYSSKLSYVPLEKLQNKWKGSKDEIEISVYLSNSEDPKFKEQLDIFKILKNNPQILKDYKDLKRSMNGKTYKDYQIAKYEFYNHVLGIN